MSKTEDFVHFHTHSDMSQLDGCGKISDFVTAVKERGGPALAFTEHGTMRGYYNQLLECQEQGVKPIYGIEFYVAMDMNRKGLTDEERADIGKGMKRTEATAAVKDWEEKHGIRDRWHLTVWAKNMAGLQNLYKLSSKAYLEGFYYKPRIDLKTLIEHGDGLAVATGCLSSPINDRVCLGQKRAALEKADMLREAFGEDLWLEIQPHAIKDQRVANRFALKLKERWGKHARLLACQDAHYVNNGDHEAHEIMLCIGTGTNMSDPDRFKFDGEEFYFKTRKQMYDTFQRNHEFIPSQMLKESLDNTMMLNEQIEPAIITIDRFKCLMPEIDVPKQHPNEFEWLKSLCVEGWGWRDVIGRAQTVAKHEGSDPHEVLERYKARLRKELTAIKSQNFVDYFLLVYDLYEWVRAQDIMCGPGRGSAAGSLVSFLLGITSVDPIEHGLIFERFISPSRIDMPDIDMDFEDVRRQEIIDHLREKYGSDKVCQIATVGKLSGKQCLKDISRVLNVPYAEVNAVTNSIIERSSGDERASQTIEDSFREFKVCQDFNAKYPDVLKYAKKLEGMAKNLGIHAAGVITSPVPLVELIPLEQRNHNGEWVTVSAIDMYGVAAMGLLKLDVLGLRTLTVLNDSVKAIKERHGETIDLEELPLDDKKVLKGFTDHKYVGIFQYDSPGADKICSGVKFKHFEDIAAMTALNRPGTARSGLATQYVARKKNPKLVEKTAMHPLVSEITKDTLGIIVYQEHVLRIFTDIAGFAPATADSLRKKIAKKWGDESIGKERENFIKGCKKTCDMDAKTAGKIMDAITFFGSYGFNKSHATAYGIIAYWGMWLKLHYPLEFFWALLKNEPARIRIQQFAKDAKNHGIELFPPSVSASRKHFAIDPTNDSIIGSLVDIKGVGEAAATSIMENQPYTDLWDFLERVERRKVHKGVVVALVKAGALDEFLPNVKWFLENVEDFWKKWTSNKGKEECRDLLKASKNVPDFAEEERQLVAASVSPLAFGRHPIDAYEEFINRHVKVPIEAMCDEDFFKNNNDKGVYIAGVVVEVKYNQIGDFHTGELPDKDERDKMFWGARYANVNVEDSGGKQNRIKVDIDIFDDFRSVVDAGIGTPVIVHATPNKRFENMRAHFLVDLEAYRKKVEVKDDLNLWERILDGDHPTAVYPWKVGYTTFKTGNGNSKKVKNSDNRVGNLAFFAEASDRFTGIITHVKMKFDRNDNEMAFFGMIGASGAYIDAICFGSYWDAELKSILKSGNHIKIQLDRKHQNGRWTYFFNGGSVRWFKKSAARVGAA